LKKFECTAKDVSITETTVGNVIDGCTGPGDTTTFELGARLVLSTNERFDIGVYLSLDGKNVASGGAQFGSCSISTLPSSYLSLDGDACGDMDTSHANVVLNVGQVTVPCIRDADGNLVVASCVSWRQPGANDTCSGPEQAFPGTGSKCDCADLHI